MNGFLFPGQGTQQPGMGQALARAFPEAIGPLIAEAAALRPELPELMRRGPVEQLSLTQNAQLAVTAVNLGALAVLRARDVPFDVVAGHSVGLLAALVAADCLDAPAALALAAGRGALMGALPTGGAMVSVTGIPPAAAEAIARRTVADCGEPVVVALVNGPETVVLSGTLAAVEYAAEEAIVEGARTTRLKVSHAFHSPLMAPALDEWRTVVAGVPLHSARVPVIADSSGEPLTDAADLRAHLIAQLTAPVRWDLVCERLGERHCVEVGDSKTLRAFARAYPGLSVASMAMPPTLAHLRDHGCLPVPLTRSST